MPRTPSRVQLEVVCAASVRSPPAAQAKLTSTRKGNDRRLKRGLNPVKMPRLIQALGILTYTKRCASAPQGYPGTNSCVRPERQLTSCSENQHSSQPPPTSVPGSKPITTNPRNYSSASTKKIQESPASPG